MALLETSPTLLIIRIDADIANKSVDNATADVMDDCIGILDIKYRIPAKAPTTKVKAKIVFIDPVADADAFSINANIAISVPKATVAPANFLPSTNDKATIAPAITAIAAVMTMRFFMQSVAPRVDRIIRDNMTPKATTAATPLAKSEVLIILKTTTAAAITPIATAIAIILPLTSAAPLVERINPIMSTPKRPTAATPLVKLPRLIIPRRMHTPARIPIAIDTAKMVPDTFAISCSLLTFNTWTKAATKTTNPTAKKAPFTMSFSLRSPASLHTPTISIIDTDIDINNPLICAI